MRWRPRLTKGQAIIGVAAFGYLMALLAGVVYAPEVPVEGSTYRVDCGSVVFPNSSIEACQFTHDGTRVLALFELLLGFGATVYYVLTPSAERREISEG